MSETAITTEKVAATEEPKVVTLTAEEHAKLVKDAADTTEARRLQGQADARAARLQAALTGKGGSSFARPAAQAAPSEAEKADYAAEEDRKAVVGLQRLALEPEYRAALDADPTLRGLFQNNPLAVLPLMAPGAYDAEDAVSLVKQALTERATKAKTTVVIEPKVEEKPVVVPAGATAVATPILDEEYETARKQPKIEDALKGMISTGLKKLGGKNGS